MLDYMFVSSDGALCDTRPNANVTQGIGTILRDNYSRTHATIRTSADVKATLRAGAYVWPGGYPMFFLTSDGAALSFETVRTELASVLWSIQNSANDGWRVVACAVNWEDENLTCEHSGESIESAYGGE